MGNLIWHEYARYVTLSATLYSIWAAFWGMYYRKFFWDFVGGTLRSPGGLQPADNVSFFIDIIVKVPVVQILTMIHGLAILAVGYPLPYFKDTAIHRSFVLPIVMLFGQAFLTVLFYQGTNGTLWSLVAIFCWIRAISLGEVLPEAKANRGARGKA